MLKKSSTTFLKLVLFGIAALILAGLLYFPQIEGRNSHATNRILIYFNDPFLAYIYLGSLLFFTGIYFAIKMLGLIEHNQAFTHSAVKTLRNMKYSALALMGFILLAMPWIFMFGQDDDAPGVVLLGLAAALVAGVLATACAVFQKLFQNAVDIKEENDLTV
jgi:apolipoprotein N-acyltransferase